MVLLGFIPLVLSVMIVNRRSKQSDRRRRNDIEAVIATTGTSLRMSIEVGAVLVAFVCSSPALFSSSWASPTPFNTRCTAW